MESIDWREQVERLRSRSRRIIHTKEGNFYEIRIDLESVFPLLAFFSRFTKEGFRIEDLSEDEAREAIRRLKELAMTVVTRPRLTEDETDDPLSVPVYCVPLNDLLEILTTVVESLGLSETEIEKRKK